MKKYISIIAYLLTFLLLLTGCSCFHKWIDADCQNPKTCSKCHLTEGEPLDHAPGEWQEIPDVISATVLREQSCTMCHKQLSSETVNLETMIQDDLFLFTPNEFMERLSLISEKYINDFTYEFISTDLGLMAYAYCGEQQNLIQFFRRNTTTLKENDIDSAVVWCVSLSSFGEVNADFRYSFFMACDPTLDMDTAFDMDLTLFTTLLNSSLAGEGFGYHQYNNLLYEVSYYDEGYTAQNLSMTMVNIYASDFR